MGFHPIQSSPLTSQLHIQIESPWHRIKIKASPIMYLLRLLQFAASFICHMLHHPPNQYWIHWGTKWINLVDKPAIIVSSAGQMKENLLEGSLSSFSEISVTLQRRPNRRLAHFCREMKALPLSIPFAFQTPSLLSLHALSFKLFSFSPSPFWNYKVSCWDICGNDI